MELLRAYPETVFKWLIAKSWRISTFQKVFNIIITHTILQNIPEITSIPFLFLSESPSRLRLPAHATDNPKRPLCLIPSMVTQSGSLNRF